MTLQEYYIGQALAGLLSQPLDLIDGVAKTKGMTPDQLIAKAAIDAARAVMKELNP